MMKVKLLSANAVIDRQRQAGLDTLGLRVERLREFHDVETALAPETGPMGRRLALAGYNGKPTIFFAISRLTGTDACSKSC